MSDTESPRSGRPRAIRWTFQIQFGDEGKWQTSAKDFRTSGEAANAAMSYLTVSAENGMSPAVRLIEVRPATTMSREPEAARS